MGELIRNFKPRKKSLRSLVGRSVVLSISISISRQKLPPFTQSLIGGVEASPAKLHPCPANLWKTLLPRRRAKKQKERECDKLQHWDHFNLYNPHCPSSVREVQVTVIFGGGSYLFSCDLAIMGPGLPSFGGRKLLRKWPFFCFFFFSRNSLSHTTEWRTWLVCLRWSN